MLGGGGPRQANNSATRKNRLGKMSRRIIGFLKVKYLQKEKTLQRMN
jgi:hypothetical protein